MYTDRSIPDEVLFGRSGYLIALLFVKRYLGDTVVPQDTIRQVYFGQHSWIEILNKSIDIAELGAKWPTLLILMHPSHY